MPILKTASWRPRERSIAAHSSHTSGRTPDSRASGKRRGRLTSNFGNKRWKSRDPGRTSGGWLFFGPADRDRESASAADSAAPLKQEVVHNLPVLFCGRIGVSVGAPRLAHVLGAYKKFRILILAFLWGCFVTSGRGTAVIARKGLGGLCRNGKSLIGALFIHGTVIIWDT